MPLCHCSPADNFFDPRKARRELKRFRKKGPFPWTRQLLDAIEQAPLAAGPTLLDIGGGVGAIHHHLLEKGFSHATHIDAAIAYVDAAKDETQRRGHAGRVSFSHGDFHELVKTAPEAD